MSFHRRKITQLFCKPPVLCRTLMSPNVYSMELMMTTAHERTKAVIDARKLLQMLASTDEISIRGLVQSVAVCLLRHYPLDTDIDVSAKALPDVWAAPAYEPVCATAGHENPGAFGTVAETTTDSKQVADDDRPTHGS